MIAREILTPLAEVNASTLEDSSSPNLNLERFWALTALSQLRHQFGTIYVLGSWYGNVALLLFMLQRHLQFDCIINDDVDAGALQAGHRRLQQLGLASRASSLHQDANHLTYDDLGPDGLVMNLSCHNIAGSDWFRHIPQGTWTVLQARDRDPGAVNRYSSFAEFDQAYPLGQELYSGVLPLRDPDGAYQQYMKIGTR